MNRHMEKSSIRSRIAGYLRHRKLHRGKISVLTAIGALVTLGVAMTLMQHGLAAQHEETVLDCHYIGEVAHTHNASCYNAAGELVCPLRERELHTHTAACYQRQLICGLEESEGHKHTDACYKDVLVCGKDELTEEHVHGEGCFKTIMVDDGQTSPDAVSTTSTDATGKGEASSSASSDATGTTSADTTTATDAPVDPTKPEQTMKKQLKDADGKAVITVEAKAPAGALADGAKMTLDWADKNDVDMKQAQDAIATKSEGKILDSQAVRIAFKDSDGNKVTPDKDVQITISSSMLGEDKDAAQIVRIMPAEEGKEGAKPTYELVDQLDDATRDSRQLTLASDQVAFDASKFATFVLAPVTDKLTMRSELEGARVRVDAPANAGIPKGATLKVSEIAQGDDGYDDYKNEALSKVEVKHTTLARFFDIKIVDASGAEVQPAEPVRVRVKVADAPAADPEPDVLHFAADGSAERVEGVETSKNIAGFDASSFSVYGVVYTVDFSYDVDGEHFETSVKGGQVANLKSLLLSLHVANKDDLNDFVAAITDVSFSNSDLVKVIKVDQDTTAGEIKTSNGIYPEYSTDITNADRVKMDAYKFTAPNYALASLKAFDSDETLTITMANGDVFTIAVTDASDTQLRADNPSKLTVHKEWRSTDDITDYPEVRFSLYQSSIQGDGTAPGGQIYVDGQGRSYENIPLNTDNNYTWECPVDLPSGHGYYVVEDTNSTDNYRCANVYQNSTVDADGFITSAGAAIPIDNGKSSKEDFYIYDYRSSTNVNHQPRTDQEMAKGWDGGLASNQGTITIENRNKEYMQFDVKKKWLVYRNSGELWTATGEPNFQKNIVIESILLRRLSAVNTEESGPGVSGRTEIPWIDGEVWEPYGKTFFWGYGSRGGENDWVVQSDNKYLATMRGGWNLNVENSNQYYRGLPEYAFYRDAKTGELKRACCNYALLEVGMYNDANRTPLNPADHPEINFDYDYIYDIAPAVWSGAGGETEIFPKVTAQDQDRLINSVASDLILQKEWDGNAPSNISHVFVKVFRKPMSDAEGDNSNLEDVTNWIGARNDMIDLYGMAYVDDVSCIGWSGERSESINPNGDIGGYLKLKSDGSPLTIKGMKLTRGDTADKLGEDNYQYWIQEIGYQKTTGEVVYDATAMNPRYSTWSATSSTDGSWNDERTSDPKGAKVTIGAKGTNRLKVTNNPSTDTRAAKRFYDAKGEPTLIGAAFGVNPPLKSVLVRVKQTATEVGSGAKTERYLTFKEEGHANPTEFIELTETDQGTGYLTYVSPTAAGSNAYKVDKRDTSWRFKPDTLDPNDPGRMFRIDPFEHELRGLEDNSTSGGSTYKYTYTFEEAGYVDRSYTGDPAFIDTATDSAFHSVEDLDWSSWVTNEDGKVMFHNSRSNIIVAKKWTDAAGNTLDPNKPQDSSITEVKFSVKQIAQKSYYSLDTYKYEPVPGENPVVTDVSCLQDVSIKEANQIITVKPNEDGSDYTLLEKADATAAQSTDMGLDNWGVRIYGLGARRPLNEFWHNPDRDADEAVSMTYTYEIVEDPIDGYVTTYDPANAAETAGTVAPTGTVTIKNKKDSIKVTFGKTFVGLDDVLDGLTTDDIKDDYDNLSDEVKKLLNIKLKLVNADDPLPAEAGTSATIFEMSLKDLIQKELATYDPATKTISGTIDNNCTVTGVNVQALLSDSAYELTESGQDQAANIPSGFAYKDKAVTKNPTNGKGNEDGELSLVISNTYEPQVDIDLLKVDIDDLDNSNPAKTLVGAEFELWKYKEVTDGDAYSDGLDADFGTGGRKTISDGTPADGKFKLEGLKPGHYELHETKVPDGHIKMDGNPRFEVRYDSAQKKVVVVPGAYAHDGSATNPDKDDVAYVVEYDGAWRIIYGNPPGSELPHAGGPGTVASTVAGVAMIAGAALYLAHARKRREAEARK